MPFDLPSHSAFIAGYINNETDYDYQQLLLELRDRARHSGMLLMAEAAGCKTEEEQKLCIRNWQTSIAAAMDMLDDAVRFEPGQDVYDLTGADGRVNFARLLYIQLDELIFRLHHYFGHCLDGSLPLPELYIAIKGSELHTTTGYIMKGLRSVGVPDALLAAIQAPFDALAGRRSEGRTSYHQFFYLQGFMGAISNLPQDRDTGRQLSALLYKWDFNAPECASVCARLYAEESDADGFQELQIPVPHMGLSWIPGFSSLMELVRMYVEKAHPEATAVQTRVVAEAPVKITSLMTVAQMAHMLRLMVETGVYVNMAPGDAIRFQSQNYSSKQSKDISAENLRQKYYTPDSPTAAAVRELLMEMMKHSKKLVR